MLGEVIVDIWNMEGWDGVQLPHGGIVHVSLMVAHS